MLRKQTIAKFILKYYFRKPVDTVVPFGPNMQRGSLMAAVYYLPLWKQTSLMEKVTSILKGRWNPNNEVVMSEAKKVIMNDVFGTPDDYGEELYNINLLHNYRQWDFSFLTSDDEEKAKALQGLRLLTGLRHRSKGTNPYLHLNLKLFSPLMCSLVEPMVLKIPVLSLRFCLEIHEEFAFNSIRQANHPQADDLIAYLYDSLVIQQKVAGGFHELLRLIADTQQKHDDSQLTFGEIEAMTLCETVVNYLKATIEKIIIILGLIFEITGLELSKTHQKKLKALDTKLPEKVKALPYFDFVWTYIQPDELEKLNNLRTGINHKRGISKLQPHLYMDKEVKGKPLIDVFSILIDQHRKNTIIFLGVLAILTDDLMFRHPTTYNELPSEFFEE